MISKINRRIALLAMGSFGFGISSYSAAQQLRGQQTPLKLVIPFAPGGAIDGVARFLALRFSDALGRPTIVDNRPGANGAIAAAAVANSPPDGTTVLLTTTSILQTLILQKHAPYRLEALSPVAKLADLPVGFAVSADMPVNNLGEFMEWVRRHPEQASYGTFGAGSSANIMGELLNIAAGTKMLHVPFRGEALALAALLGKQITAMFGATGTLAEQVKAGRLKILAVALPKRLENFPEVQTFAEAGFPGVNQPGWFGAFLPAATKVAVRDEFNELFMRVLKKPEVAKKFADYGFVSDPMPTKEFSLFVEKEYASWSKAIAVSGVSLD